MGFCLFKVTFRQRRKPNETHISSEMSDVRDSKSIQKLLSANQCAESVRSVQTKDKGCGGTLQSSLSRCAGFQSGSSGIQHVLHDVLCAHLFQTDA